MAELSYSDIEAVMKEVSANIASWSTDSERGEAQLGAVRYFADRLLIAASMKGASTQTVEAPVVSPSERRSNQRARLRIV